MNQSFVEEDEINIDEDEQDRMTEVLKKTTKDEVKEDTPTEVKEYTATEVKEYIATEVKEYTATEVKETTATEVKAMREYLCNKCPRDSRLFFVFEK